MLDAWAASPTRFREDANAEEDLLRGGYRDRWFVELAQNAADAALRAGTTCTLRVRIVEGELRVGGNGAPLDADGVVSLASLRASAKRDTGATGRFGVGFAAVTAVSDAPRLVTRRADGTVAGVAFDRARTAAEVATRPGPAAELERRGGGAPVLRLPWPTGPDEPPLPDDVTTDVRLPLADDADPDALLAAACAQAPDLLLALPGLVTVVLDGRAVHRRDDGAGRVTITDPDGEQRWRLARVGGELPAALLADLAVEDRARTGWTATWAARDDPPERQRCDIAGAPREQTHIDHERDAAVVTRDVLHAPTPTDEATTLPARLIATVPLDPDRRHVRPGPVTRHVLRAAADGYVDLVRALPGRRRLAMVPRPALPASEVDGLLRDAVVDALRTRAWLPGADGTDLLPERAIVLDPATEALAGVLAEVFPDVAAPVTGVDFAALNAVGATPVALAGLCDRLAGIERAPSWWRRLYAALDEAIAPGAALPDAREELAALPVPLADGRTVLGPRDTLIAGDDLDAEPLERAAVPGLRVVHPDAVHPLLLVLGAREADAAGLLATPALLDAVERSVDDDGLGTAGALAALVLALVARAEPAHPLGALALPDTGGEYRRADELVLPDGALRGLLGDGSPLGVLHDDVVDAHPRAALLAVGVLDGFAVLHDEDPAGPDHDLDDEEGWWAGEVDPVLDAGAEPGPMSAVRDLELIDEDRWPDAWPVLAGDPAVRGALARTGPDRPVPYTAWWLARHGRLAGSPPTAWRLPSAGGPLHSVDRDDPANLVGLYDPVPADAAEGLDPAFLVTIGVRTALAVATAIDAADLLERLADPARTLDPAAVAAAHSALADAVGDGGVAVADVDPPPRVRGADGAVHDADPGRGSPPVVLDRPALRAVLPDAVLVPPGRGDPRVLADLLDLPLASSRVRGTVRTSGTPTPWRQLPTAVAWASRLGRTLPAGVVVLHETLRVAVTDDEHPGAPVVTAPGVWDDGGTLHADDVVLALLVALTPRA